MSPIISNVLDPSRDETYLEGLHSIIVVRVYVPYTQFSTYGVRFLF